MNDERSNASSHRLTRRAAILTSAAASSLLATRGRSGAAQDATPAAESPGITPERVRQIEDRLDEIVKDAMDRTGVPGVSVAIVFEDSVVATRGYGVRSTQTGDTVDADTSFQLASVSKPMASTVIASLVGDGLVTWDTPVVDHLPDFAMFEPWVTREITIRDVFCHRSGLPDHAGDRLEDMGYDREQVLHRLRYQRPAASFRSAYAYTNFGLTAGAVSACAAAGMTWEEASATRLYHPAGMTRTSSRFDDFTGDENHAAGHVLVGDAWIPQYIRNPDAQSPAGGVSSTANDMAIWLRIQLNGGMLGSDRMLEAEPLAETHRPQIASSPAANPDTDRTGFYGLGWNVSYTDRGLVQLSHSGAFALGAATSVYLMPADRFGVVVLTNGYPIGLPESVALSVLDVAQTRAVRNDYVSLLGPVFADLMKLDYGDEIDLASPPAAPVAALDLDAYAGTYANDLYGDIVVALDGDALLLNQGPKPDTYPLTHWDRDTFYYVPTGENANAPSAVTFTIGPSGQARDVRIENLDVYGQGTFPRIV